MAKQNHLGVALEGVRRFIRSLNGVANSLGASEFDLSFAVDEGELDLREPEASAYRECLNDLYSRLPRSELITKRAVEKLFQRSIIKALTFQGGTVTTSEPQISNAIRELESALAATPKKYGVYYPVVGLNPDELPSKVGHYDFFVFGAEEVERFIGVQVEKRSVATRTLIEPALNKGMLDAVVAYREVEALEPYAARDRALRDLRFTLDVVNFYSDLIPSIRAHVSLPGDRDGAPVTAAIVDLTNKSQKTISRERVGRVGTLSLKNLHEFEGCRERAFSRVDDLLRSDRNKMEEAFLASVRWAGRATASDRTEEAFLLYIIALESLILADHQPGELSYRFRLRVAHLIGEDVEARRAIAKQVNELYSIRSSIVHSGKYEVSDADLAIMRMTVKNCIITLANDPGFCAIKSPQDFGTWIEHRILK
jgi:hypothetical protein